MRNKSNVKIRKVNNDAKPISLAHRRELDRLGILADHAHQGGVYSANESKVSRLLGREGVGPGLVFRYESLYCSEPLLYPDGTQYCRVKPDNVTNLADDDSGGYVTRYGHALYPYIPFGVSDLLKSGYDNWCLVVGEHKALHATFRTIPTLGLCHHWGWMDPSRLGELLPTLDEVLPRGKPITIVWDSKAALRLDYAESTALLQKALRARGNKLEVVVIPYCRSESRGLDDYINEFEITGEDDMPMPTFGLPERRDVTVAELMIAWSKQLGENFGLLQTNDIQGILAHANESWALNGAEDGLVSEIAKNLQEHAPVNVEECLLQGMTEMRRMGGGYGRTI